jgi:hypothetical protein
MDDAGRRVSSNDKVAAFPIWPDTIVLAQHRPLEEGKASPLEWARILFERVDQPGWQGPPRRIVERDVTRLAQAIDAFMRMRAPGGM